MTEVAINKVPVKSKIISIVITCTLGWGFSFLATNVFREYAFGLFIWLPIVMGAISTILLAYRNEVGKRQLRNNSFAVLGIFCLGLLVFAWEGVICLIMAAPLGLLFTYIGYRIGYLIAQGKMKDNTLTITILLGLSVPALMAFEKSNDPDNQLRSVTTSIEIDASPAEVWKNVVEFPPLEEPTEFIFRSGIAYPINAQITGKG